MKFRCTSGSYKRESIVVFRLQWITFVICFPEYNYVLLIVKAKKEKQKDFKTFRLAIKEAGVLQIE